MAELSPEPKPILRLLDNLIAVNRDASASVALALRHVKDPALVVELQRMASSHDAFVDQLERARGAYCADAAPTGSFTGGLHRVWIRVRSAVPVTPQRGVLREVLRGARFALRHYHATLQQHHVLPVGLIALIAEQRQTIKLFRERMRAWWRSGELPTLAAPVSTTSATLAIPALR